MEPFHKNVWYSLLAYSVFMTFIMLTRHTQVRTSAKNSRNSEKFAISLFAFCKIFLHIFSANFGNAAFQEPFGDRFNGLRTLIFGICLVGNTFFISYGAFLTSALAVKKAPAIPFSNFEEFYESGYGSVEQT